VIVVVGRVRTDAERRERLIEIGQTVARASREEAGCLSYRVCEDTEVENDFVFVEEWQDDAALQAHFATPHIAAFMGAIQEAIVAPPEVKFHEIASTRDLSNVAAPR
jgi:quinol monooxygenase YgiN